MSTPGEFHYRIPHRLGAWRPGAHPATTLGAGQEFVSHTSLYDKPDPRRLDLRASLRDVRNEWLVRVNRQRAAVPVHVLVDVSASMAFGERRPKLHAVADFVEALGQSAFRVGDTVGLSAFDAVERLDLFVPAVRSRGSGNLMASRLRSFQASASGVAGLDAAALRFVGRPGLIFIASDFHWPLERLAHVLDLLARAYVVPVVVWDRAEVHPPTRSGLVPVQDMETHSQRMLWMRPSLRERWEEKVEARRAELRQFFANRGMRPFFVTGEFDCEAMSRYFLEAAA